MKIMWNIKVTAGRKGAFRLMKSEKSCGAVIIRKSNNNIEYLAIQSRAYGGEWGFPKGHMETGENQFETAVREVFEETGLKIEIANGFRSVIHYQPAKDVQKEVVYFMASVDAEDEVVIQEEEVRDYRWLSYRETLDLLSYELSKQVLREVNQFLQDNNIY